ncbi:Phosphoribosylglycinamide formyltransferase [Symmachiella macrocystis]|uniref:Phosphoribosylglycinamide formyltransferase n=2 Tax=Symmachiella macrocystis TaxID=2527985 RepID=A0A5C6BCQ8_9PLAN|nr:Phosphoribosylglycinamide formyltransferase [Symmachiella macrocystis]
MPPRFPHPKANGIMPVVRPVALPLNRPIRLAVLLSGGGTTLTNLLEHKVAGQLDAEVPLVIASRANCGGVTKAQAAGLDCRVISRKDFEETSTFSTAVFDACRDAEVDLVVLAGYLSLLEIPQDFALRVMNIHPALIPAFCGAGFYGGNVHEAVLARGAKVSGCTVHFSDNIYDNGPIILQRPVPVLDDDTPQTLAARVFEAEREAYPEAIRLFAAGRLEVDGRRVRILPAADALDSPA